MKNPETPMTSADEYQKHKVRGENILNEYYVQFTNTPVKELYGAEKEIRYTDEDGIKFKGFIDRIDKTKDGYIIYDYKTGLPKGENKICEGGENEHYYNQIALYKYLFEKSEKQAGRQCKVINTTFIFPEGCTENYTASIDDDECLRVVQKYKNIISDMKQYEFNPKPRLQEKTCEYCPHKGVCPKWDGGRFINCEIQND